VGYLAEMLESEALLFGIADRLCRLMHDRG